jgi:hypothetical protein
LNKIKRDNDLSSIQIMFYQLPFSIVSLVGVILYLEDNFHVNGLSHLRARPNNEQVKTHLNVYLLIIIS